MIGIAGIVRRGGPPLDPADEERLLAAIARGARREAPAFRGTDAFLCGGERAPEPGVIFFSGRLDDLAGLQRSLGEGAPPVAGPANDAAFAGAAFAKWGERTPEFLLGDFALAAFDASERRLFLARDAIGVIPVYYHLTPARFAFATELGALLALPWIPREPDELRIADYVAVYFDDREATFYRAIRRLPPAHALAVQPAAARTRRYWALDPAREIVPASDEEAAERFRALFCDAVGARLRRAAHPALLLSGGLDSASILCAAQGFSPSAAPLATFSAVFPSQSRADETRDLDLLLAEVRAAPTIVRADLLSPLGASREMLRHLRQPYHAPNLFVYWSLARAAHEAGVTALLDGVDGDTTVSHGFEYLAELFRGARWLAWLRETRSLARRLGTATLPFLWRFGVLPSLTRFAGERYGAFGAGAPGTPPPLLDRDCAERVEWRAKREDAIAALGAAPPTLRAAHHRQLASGLIPFYLEVNHLLSAPLGIEARHPYYDRRLIEYCLALPPALRLQDGWDRRVQRLAMAGMVPERVRLRLRKAHWGRNFEESFLVRDRGLIEETLEVSAPRLRQFLDLGRLQAAMHRTAAGGRRADDVMDLWVATTLGLWLVSEERASASTAVG
ncbi:MAG: asparagine synthase-related protein [Planctomycetes bacterium]|nr:asparagine synthase-related protein [Planctomycetota bacterium]